MKTWSLDATPIGASGERALLCERALESCFDAKQGFLARKQPSIILGGDIDAEAWNETVRRFSSKKLCSALVKVSHHGSATGFCEGLWHRLSPRKTAVAVITPFPGQGLASAEGLTHISTNANLTLSASVGPTAMAVDWENTATDTSFQGMSAVALVTLRAVFLKASRPAERLAEFRVKPHSEIFLNHY
ncbi:MAG: hypothetical protein M1608_08725 [Candidatus Omnitrophica bacterium]|nr:hypothetical protein [Candidatus Omnitrophota bacterium]